MRISPVFYTNPDPWWYNLPAVGYVVVALVVIAILMKLGGTAIGLW